MKFELADGSKDAPVTLLYYGDYASAASRHADALARSLKGRFGSSLRLVFRPLVEVGGVGANAARAAEAAAMQRFFWEMHGVLFENQDALGTENIYDYVAALGLDFQRLEQDFESAPVRELIRQAREQARRDGVSVAPAFLINGVRHQGPLTLEALSEAISSELERGSVLGVA